MSRAIPTGREIKSREGQPIEFCQATSIIITNKSNGLVSYSFGGIKFELEENEVDTWLSPHDPMDGRIDFTILAATTIINIKVKIIQKV